MSKILYVEDDENLGFVTKDNLEEEGFEIVHFTDGQEAFKNFMKEKYDLCLLDVMLPELDGFSLAEKIRAQNQHIPIIFLSAKTMQEDRISGLKVGGDDYITKPFSIEELCLRIKVFLKRNTIFEESGAKDEFDFGKFHFNFSQLILDSEDGEQKLTHREAEVLKYLCERPNTLIKREDILTKIWGRDDYFLGRSLDVFITRLRKMLQTDENIKIDNVHGVGFRFVTE
ncbi:response regulator transcription factor [Marinilongibacter aquaticus]|uniref:response regulator transcription factor n=1 Tax=Marinilongibacter aquaticus TaxID=2975157 RepID=UPI0021BD732F|nr:response regulator transcription factor [Marinilongibacter aquaticus]UBM60252.1 response regulator transcription factor [Marinilongibacter aquaticus]